MISKECNDANKTCISNMMKLQSTVSCTCIRYVNRYLFISNRIIKQKYMPLIHNLINNVVHCGVTPKNKCLVSVQTISIQYNTIQSTLFLHIKIIYIGLLWNKVINK